MASDLRPTSLGALIAKAYPTLQRMALTKCRGADVSPSSVVQETLVRILHQREAPLTRAALEATAWRIMEWVLIDRVRSERARRGREQQVAQPQQLPELNLESPAAERVHALLSAMSELAQHDPRRADTATLALACGLPYERVAEMTGVSVKTVQRDVAFARSWLAHRMQALLQPPDPSAANHSLSEPPVPPDLSADLMPTNPPPALSSQSIPQ